MTVTERLAIAEEKRFRAQRTAERDERIVRLRLAEPDISLSDIGRRFNICSTSIGEILRKRGLK